jgi:hypothetical protein
LKERLETELVAASRSVDPVSTEGVSNASYVPQNSMNTKLSKLEQSERAFHHADFAYRNAKNSLQSMQETDAIVTCNFLCKLQSRRDTSDTSSLITRISVEENRLAACTAALMNLGQVICGLQSAIDQFDTSTSAAFANMDVQKDLREV